MTDFTTRRVYVAIDVNASKYAPDRDVRVGVEEVLRNALGPDKPLRSSYMLAMHTNETAPLYFVDLTVLPEPKSISVIEV